MFLCCPLQVTEREHERMLSELSAKHKDELAQLRESMEAAHQAELEQAQVDLYNRTGVKDNTPNAPSQLKVTFCLVLLCPTDQKIQRARSFASEPH